MTELCENWEKIDALIETTSSISKKKKKEKCVLKYELLETAMLIIVSWLYLNFLYLQLW